MGYAVYRDPEGYNRWAGYGVPAVCDWSDCSEEIYRGLGYKCEKHGHYVLMLNGREISYDRWDSEDDAEEEWVDDEGCNLYFCEKHRDETDEHEDVQPKGDILEWKLFMLRHESWEQWRKNNPETEQSLADEFEKSSPEQRERAEKFLAAELDL